MEDNPLGLRLGTNTGSMGETALLLTGTFIGNSFNGSFQTEVIRMCPGLELPSSSSNSAVVLPAATVTLGIVKNSFLGQSCLAGICQNSSIPTVIFTSNPSAVLFQRV